jgi:hypothetical protein
MAEITLVIGGNASWTDGPDICDELQMKCNLPTNNP